MPSARRGMACCWRRVIWSLCFLLLLEDGSAKNIWKRTLPEDPHVKEVDEFSPLQPLADLCPPPPHTLPPGACDEERCRADSECLPHRRCCYNGCTYTCLEPMPPPPAEVCSTTEEDGAEPLLCPSGYECHILYPGDMEKGIPNRGQCVQQRQQKDGLLLKQEFDEEQPESDSENMTKRRGRQKRFR